MLPLTKSHFADLAQQLFLRRRYTDIGARVATLPNGVRIITRRIPHEPITDIAILIDAGSRNEAYGNHIRGVAHFFEHMPFRGSYQLGQGEFAPHEAKQKIIGLGGAIGASVGAFTTNYWAYTPAKGVTEAITILSSMVCRPKLAEAEIELERPAIHIEWLESQLDAKHQQYWRTLQTAYNYHPSTHPVLGTERTILSIQKSDMVAFHRAHYTGDNIIVSIEGNVDHDTAVAQLQKEFNLPRGDRNSDSLPEYTGGGAVFPESVNGTRIRLAFHCKGQKDQNVRAAYGAVAGILGNGFDSILLGALRSTRGLVYGVDCINDVANELLTISFNTFPARVGTCLHVIRDELDKLRTDGNQYILARNKRAGVLGYQVFARQSKRGALDMAYVLLKDGYVPDRGYYFRQRQAVTSEAIKTAVDQMLQRPLTLVAAGDVSQVPAYETVREMYLVKTPSAPPVSSGIASPGTCQP